MKGRVINVDDYRIKYGVEEYFVPQFEGLEIEKNLQIKNVYAELAVGTQGESAIKRLFINNREQEFN